LSPRRQHNVTFSPQSFLGKPFPCPLCDKELHLKISCREKPYCMCLDCGIQIFFRGKEGIARLQEMIASEAAVVLEFSAPARAIFLYHRLQHLKRQKDRLEKKQGVIFRDADRDRVIEALKAEIRRVRSQLEEAKKGGEEDQ
jgi:hypothetical protein